MLHSFTPKPSLDELEKSSFFSLLNGFLEEKILINFNPLVLL